MLPESLCALYNTLKSTAIRTMLPPTTAATLSSKTATTNREQLGCCRQRADIMRALLETPWGHHAGVVQMACKSSPRRYHRAVIIMQIPSCSYHHAVIIMQISSWRYHHAHVIPEKNPVLTSCKQRGRHSSSSDIMQTESKHAATRHSVPQLRVGFRYTWRAGFSSGRNP